MQTRKVAGWCLLVLGAAKVFQAIHLHALMGQRPGAVYAVVVSLLFTAGAAFLWLEKAPTRARVR